MIARLTKPEAGNIYYNTTAAGGINPGKPNPKRTDPGLTALANCVSYAIGRFNEIGGYEEMRYLGAYYPYAMIALAKRQGLTISKEPTLGGMMVWTGGPTKEGHVDIVEQINRDEQGKIKSIITSDSEYYRHAFTTFNRKLGRYKNWGEGCSWMGSSYIFAGCIDNPAVEEEEPVTYEQFCKFMAQYEADQKKKPATDDFAKGAIDFMKEKGYMVGDQNGNTMPQAYLTREQYCILTRNILNDNRTQDVLD